MIDSIIWVENFYHIVNSSRMNIVAMDKNNCYVKIELLNFLPHNYT